MTENQIEDTELANIEVNAKSMYSPEVKNSYSFIRLCFANLIIFAVLIMVGWYFIVQPYIDSIERRLSDAVSAARGMATLSEVQSLRVSIDELQAKIAAVGQYDQRFADIQQELQAVQAKLKDLDQEKSNKAIKATTAFAWKDAISKAIATAEPLEELRKNPLLPEKVRELMVGIDFIPTHKNISESWSAIRNSIKFQEQSTQALPVKQEGWWNGFKDFLKGMFKVQRLNKENLTAEEVFSRHVDTLLIENEIFVLLEYMLKHEDRFDTQTQALVKEWINKLKIYQQGQLILKMVNISND